jgi:hypothetical protein
MIFIALALGWAIYLIPKALQQHEEMARSRSVESFSSRLRVLGAKGVRHVESAPEAAPVEAPVASQAEPRPVVRPVTRAAARRAAARRRRVLYALTFLLVASVGAAYLGYLPRLAVAAPVVLIVAFLVIARMTVRRQQVAVRPQQPVASPLDVAPVETLVEPSPTEDTVGVSRAELAAQEQAIADDGALWDPLPMTLPTYVSKPTARRTVRTIELTGGKVTSSGHDAADSKLVRDVKAAENAQAAETPDADQRRKAAGA